MGIKICSDTKITLIDSKVRNKTEQVISQAFFGGKNFGKKF